VLRCAVLCAHLCIQQRPKWQWQPIDASPISHDGANVGHVQVKTSRTFLRDCTVISPLALLLFGGPLAIAHAGGYVSIDRFRVRKTLTLTLTFALAVTSTTTPTLTPTPTLQVDHLMQPHAAYLYPPRTLNSDA